MYALIYDDHSLGESYKKVIFKVGVEEQSRYQQGEEKNGHGDCFFR